MCGIFGLVVSERAALSSRWHENALRRLIGLSEPRGKEAAGLAIATGANVRVFKRSGRPIKMVRSREYQRFIQACFENVPVNGSGGLAAPLATIGQCRLVTSGSEHLAGNNQPIITDHCVGVHNGIVVNERELWAEHPGLRKSLQVDSEVIFALLDRYVAKTLSLQSALALVFDKIYGATTVAILRDDAAAVALATNTGTLYTALSAKNGLFMFASEKYALEQFLKSPGLPSNFDDVRIDHLEADSGCIIDFHNVTPKIFSLSGAVKQPLPVAGSRAVPSLIVEECSSKLRALRRCRKCVLPESYPRISFDAQGVCNLCRAHRRQKLRSRKELERVLEKYRNKNGEPDCIVAFSGGRDSSYGLHVIKTELGLNPIAFTFDWGMVTDLARRNQARLCHKLGVQHFIRAADIPAKRRYIRKNVLAWLKRPKLGMIPLFMAGDKMFYHYPRQLRKETGIQLVIFCAGHETEKTNFKIEFCGFEGDMKGQMLTAIARSTKLRLFLWYAKECILNPRYFNESFWDGVFAFYSSFVVNDDFLYLYHYVPYDIGNVEKLLKEEYDWEEASDTKNTWRIDDGYTSFINYIFWSVAGFTEFDVFRSQQIREGQLTRDQELNLLMKENEPRIDEFSVFCEWVGLSVNELLAAINQIPKLY